MDERTRGLTDATKTGAAAKSADARPPADDPEKEAEQLEEKVDALRDNLGSLVGELDRRRHRAAKPLLIGVALLGGVAVAGTIAGLIWRRHRRTRRQTRLAKLRQAWRRAVAHPDRVASEKPNAKKQILVATGAAIASAAARRLAQRWIAARDAG